MANSFQFSIIICLFFLVEIAPSQSQDEERFIVEGQVYCDTCRAQFITRLSTYMPGAKVRLQCKDQTTGDITYGTYGETDNSGTYHLEVVGDHEDEVCEVGLIRSSDLDCAELATSSNNESAVETAKITITNNNGIVSSIRRANPIGFKKTEALPECAEVFQELGIVPDEN